MINIEYSNDKIKVETKKVSKVFETPLTLSVKSHVSGEEIWSSQLNDGWWAEFPNSEMNDVVIYDRNGKLITSRKWEVIQDGSELYKSIYFYCKEINDKGRKPKGIAVGTHDGLFGEWVPCVLSNLSDAILVEASQKQYSNLKKYFGDKKNVILLNTLITSDGKPVEFFEGGLGYTNSVVERVIKKWEKEEIKSSIRESISIENLISQFTDGKIDWLHTDVEGYDSKILMSIPDSLLPGLIIFEHENMGDEENEILRNFLTARGYELDYQKVSCVAFR